jgi:hypothetical protein
MQPQVPPEYASELARRQAQLQAEAARLVGELDLFAMLAVVGTPRQVGSSLSGLMVYPDVDFNIASRDPSLASVYSAMLPLLTRPGVVAAQYRNEARDWAPPDQPENSRYFFAVRYAVPSGRVWKLDFSFWLSDAPRGEADYLDYLKRELTDETRLTILWIKDVWRKDPTYPYEVGGYDVYEAVLKHGVRTPAQFAAYLTERGLSLPASTS